jgi:hypothetical protein
MGRYDDGIFGDIRKRVLVKPVAPDPSPRQRWTKNLFDLAVFGSSTAIDSTNCIYVAVPDRNSRLKLNLVRNTIYSRDRGLPQGSFLEIGEGVSISCPELLFAEMAELMDIPHLVLLGYELCGSFARDPDDPRNGDVALFVNPATSVDAIASYLDELKWTRGVERARFALDFVADNAWSPTEAVIATVAALPGGEFGYEMGRCHLNVRVETSSGLERTNAKSSRVPDILLMGTKVGFNYDGAVHLDLASIVEASALAERYPDDAFFQTALDKAMRAVRSKVVDDIRRNRELAAEGYTVLSITKEDLYEDGGLDNVVMQAIAVLEGSFNKDMSVQRRLLESQLMRTRRQELIWSLMPGRQANRPPRKIIWPGVKNYPFEMRTTTIGI